MNEETNEILKLINQNIMKEFKKETIQEINMDYAYGLTISTVKCENFQGFQKLNVEFKKGINVVIGDNFEGKSSIINLIDFALGGDVGPVLSAGREIGSAKLQIVDKNKKGLLSLNLVDKSRSTTGDRSIINTLNINTDDNKIFVWRNKLGVEQRNYGHTNNKRIFISGLNAFRWSPYISFLKLKINEFTEIKKELKAKINRVENEIHSQALLANEIEEYNRQKGEYIQMKEKIVYEIRNSFYRSNEDNFDELEKQYKSNLILIEKYQQKRSEAIGGLKQYSRLRRIPYSSRLLNKNMMKLHCPLCKKKIDLKDEGVCSLCGNEGGNDSYDDVELMAHTEIAEERTDKLEKEIKKLNEKIRELQIENESIIESIKNFRNDEKIDLDKKLQNTIIKINEFETQIAKLNELLQDYQGKESVLKSNNLECLKLEEKIQSFLNAIDKLTDFKLDVYSQNLLDNWIRLWCSVFNIDLKDWKPEISDDALNVKITSLDGKKIYGLSNRNAGTEEDILTLTYQIASIQTFFEMGGKVRWNLMAIDDPLKGMDSMYAEPIIKIIKNFSEQFGFQIILTAQPDKVEMLKKCIRDANCYRIKDISTPYTTIKQEKILSY